MADGFLEFCNGPYVIIRGGPGCRKYGDTPTWAIVCQIDGGFAEPVGVCTAPITLAIVRDLAKALAEKDLKLKWTRFQNVNGENVMSKYGFPHIKEAKSGSTVNWKGIQENLRKAEQHEKKGEVEFRDFQVNEEDIGNGDTKLTASVIRHEK